MAGSEDRRRDEARYQTTRPSDIFPTIDISTPKGLENLCGGGMTVALGGT
jgi:hypothetical protein